MNYDEFFEKFLGGRDHPLHASLELTHRCNLFCGHCYIPLTRHRREGNRAAIRETVAGELSTEGWLRIADSLAAAGCLDVLLTGGDPLVRRDFLEIYDYFKRLGMVVTVFTNGTLLDEALVAHWSEWPPMNVEVSIYGASEATYGAVTGVPGAWARVSEGLDRLDRHGIPYVLKSVLLEPNRHEVDAMRAIAADRGVRFRFATDVFPEYMGCKTPKDLAPSPGDAAAVAARDPVLLATWSGEVEDCGDLYAPGHVTPTNESSGELFSCKAGRKTLSINPEGKMQFCLMLRHLQLDLASMGFDEAWQALRGLRATRKSGPTRCDDCGIRSVCQSCPARNYLETGNPELPGDDQCTRTHAIAVALGKTPIPLERFLAERREREAHREPERERPWRAREEEIPAAHA